MPQSNRVPPSDAWMDARVEAYVDDALSGSERLRFERGLRADSHWREQVTYARSIRRLLTRKNPPSAPSELATSIVRQILSSSASLNGSS